MDPRFVWLDALVALGLGQELHRLGDSAEGIVLYGAPYTVLVFDELLAQGWIAPLPCGRRYVLTSGGRQALRDGAAWYRALPAWRRLLNPRPALALAERRMGSLAAAAEA